MKASLVYIQGESGSGQLCLPEGVPAQGNRDARPAPSLFYYLTSNSLPGSSAGQRFFALSL